MEVVLVFLSIVSERIMGEKIKDLAKASINDNEFLIELNKATVNGGPRYIHLQNNSFRLCITEREYMQIACSLLKSKKNFLHNKGVK